MHNEKTPIRLTLFSLHTILNILPISICALTIFNTKTKLFFVFAQIMHKQSVDLESAVGAEYANLYLRRWSVINF